MSEEELTSSPLYLVISVSSSDSLMSLDLPKFRFMAMSKLIGVIAFGFVFGITVYSMIEMHNTGDYSNLGQLIISAYGFASVYAGFYLLMAKVEHVEEEKTKRDVFFRLGVSFP